MISNHSAGLGQPGHPLALQIKKSDLPVVMRDGYEASGAHGYAIDARTRAYSEQG